MSAPPMEFLRERGGRALRGVLTRTLRLRRVGGFKTGPLARQRGQEPARTGAPVAGVGPGRSRNVPARMRPSRLLPALLAVSLLWLAPPARAAYHARQAIPRETPGDKWVEDLATGYSLSRGLLLTRPWTRAELGAFLDQLVADQPGAARDPVVVRLRRELEPGGGLRGGLEPLGQADAED